MGTFLEHARIFYFYNDGHEEIYMGSADWMPRNLDRRVEIVFPVEEEELKEKIGQMFIVCTDSLDFDAETEVTKKMHQKPSPLK